MVRFAQALILCATVLAAGCGGPRATSAPPAVRGGMLPVPGGSIYYEVAGAGPPVVFIHGGFGDRRMWNAQFEAFADSFRVVRYDIRGFGRSPAPAAPYSAADDFLRLLDHLGMTNAHVVGNSMGGTLALDISLMDPTRVRSLTIVAAGPSGMAAPEENIARIVAVFEAAQRDGPAAAAELWLQHDMVRITSRDRRTAPLLREMVEDNADAFLMPWAHWPSAGLDPPAAGRLAEVSVPTLVIVGADDIPFVRTAAAAVAAGVPGARLEVLAGADHLPQMGHADRVNALLRRHLLVR